MTKVLLEMKFIGLLLLLLILQAKMYMYVRKMVEYDPVQHVSTIKSSYLAKPMRYSDITATPAHNNEPQQ